MCEMLSFVDDMVTAMGSTDNFRSEASRLGSAAERGDRHDATGGGDILGQIPTLLINRDLRGVKLIVATEHKGLKAVVAKVLGAIIHRYRVHRMRNALAGVGKKGKAIVSPALRTAFEVDSFEASKGKWRKLIDAFESHHTKLSDLMIRAEEDVLA